MDGPSFLLNLCLELKVLPAVPAVDGDRPHPSERPKPSGDERKVKPFQIRIKGGNATDDWSGQDETDQSRRAGMQLAMNRAEN
jgi:hypothetical protein